MMSSHRYAVPYFALLFLVVFAISDAANAAQVPIVPSPSLDDLVDDPLDPADDASAFLVSSSGRFRFDNFTLNAVPPAGGFVPSPEEIFVTVMETANNVMLLFQVVGDNIAAGPQAFELQVGYEAHTTDPLDVFTGHSLFMNGRGLGNGNIVINEQILGDGGALVGQLTTHSNLPNQGSQVTDSTVFGSRQTSVAVDKDISLNGGTAAGNGVAFLSHFKETFDVERVPEPSTALLLAFAAIGLGIVARATHRG